MRKMYLSIACVCFIMIGNSQAQGNGDIIIKVKTELFRAAKGATVTLKTQKMTAVKTIKDGDPLDSDGSENGEIYITALRLSNWGAAHLDTITIASVSKLGYKDSPELDFGNLNIGANKYKADELNDLEATLEYNVRVLDVKDIFDSTLNIDATNTSFSGLRLAGSDTVSYSRGWAYFPADTAVKARLNLSRNGFVNVQTSNIVEPSATGRVNIRFGSSNGFEGPALTPTIIVEAKEEFGRSLILKQSNTNFKGLSLVDLPRYRDGKAYLPANPSQSGRLTLEHLGFVITTTSSPVSPSATEVDTIRYQPEGGHAPGLPYTLMVRAWDQFGSQRLILTYLHTTFNISNSLMNGAIHYNDSSAFIPLKEPVAFEISQSGYITTPMSVEVSIDSTKRDTVDFKPGSSRGSGLLYALKLVILNTSHAPLAGSSIQVLGGDGSFQKDIYTDSVWSTPSPSAAPIGQAYLALRNGSTNGLDDDNTLAIRVQNPEYLLNISQHLSGELNTSSQVVRFIQMTDFLKPPTLSLPTHNAKVDSGQPLLNWVSIPGAADYQVQLSTDQSFTNIARDTIVDTTIARVKALEDNQLYYWRVRARGYDNAPGPYSAVSLFQIILDNEPPVAIAIHPGIDSILSDTVTLKFQARDNDTIISRQISIDGQPFAATTGDSTHRLPTAPLLDGSHTIQYKIEDGGGNISFSRIITVFTHNSPEPAILVRMADTSVAGKTVIEWSTHLSSSTKVKNAWIQVDGGKWEKTSGLSSDTLDTKIFKNGSHTMRIKVRDTHQKEGLSQTLQFKIDNQGPDISSIKTRYPSNQTAVKSGDTLIVTAYIKDAMSSLATDSSVLWRGKPSQEDSVIYFVMSDNGTAKSGDEVKGDGIFTTKVPIGVRQTKNIPFSIIATDNLGNKSTLNYYFTADNIKPVVAHHYLPNLDGSKTVGKVYDEKLILKVKFSDARTSVQSAVIHQTNDSGQHVNTSPITLPVSEGEVSQVLVLSEGLNFFTLKVLDGAGNINSSSDTIQYILPKITQWVQTKGGTLISPNQSGIIIPKGALFQSTEITMNVLPSELEYKPLNENIVLLGKPHAFGPDGLTFNRPVTIKLAYTDFMLDPNQDGVFDFKPQDLAIYFWEGTDWVLAGPANVDTKKKSVSVNVNHFTLFDIGVDTSSADDQKLTKFKAYWMRNPVLANEGSNMVIHLPKPGKLSLKILDMAGDVVHSLYNNEKLDKGVYTPQWRGDNVHGDFAGAGLYIYILQYKSNDKKINKVVRKPLGLLKE